jgi:hypothetical protein
LIDAEGDLIVGDAADAVQRLAVGSDGNVLTVDTTVDGKIKWAAPAGATANYSLLNSGGTALTGAQTITVSGISGIASIMVLINDASSANASSFINMRLNTDTGSNYAYLGIAIEGKAAYAANFVGPTQSLSATSFRLGKMSNNATSVVNGGATILGCNSAGIKTISNSSGGTTGSTPGDGQVADISKGFYSGTSVITSVSLVSSTGNFDGGTVYIYGSAV